eukprot:15362499-Alexandrium_andersonii.AAC.1
MVPLACWLAGVAGSRRGAVVAASQARLGRRRPPGVSSRRPPRAPRLRRRLPAWSRPFLRPGA